MLASWSSRVTTTSSPGPQSADRVRAISKVSEVIDRPKTTPPGSAPSSRPIAARAPTVVASVSRSGAATSPRWHIPEPIAAATACATWRGTRDPPGPSKRASPLASAGNDARTSSRSMRVMLAPGQGGSRAPVTATPRRLHGRTTMTRDVESARVPYLPALGTVLTVWAHPDDEAYLVGGLLALLTDAGQRAVCVTATRGEAADPDAGPAERTALAALRTGGARGGAGDPRRHRAPLARPARRRLCRRRPDRSRRPARRAARRRPPRHRHHVRPRRVHRPPRPPHRQRLGRPGVAGLAASHRGCCTRSLRPSRSTRRWTRTSVSSRSAVPASARGTNRSSDWPSPGPRSTGRSTRCCGRSPRPVGWSPRSDPRGSGPGSPPRASRHRGDDRHGAPSVTRAGRSPGSRPGSWAGSAARGCRRDRGSRRRSRRTAPPAPR